VGLLDKFIGALSPSWQVNRQLNKQRSKFLADAGGNYGTGNYYGPYQGATATRVSAPWFISQKDPQFRFASLAALRAMRDRARTLERNNEIAAGLLNRTVENVVGPKGFQLQVTANNPAWSPQQNAAWNAKAQSLMEHWFTTADISGLTWVEHQKTVFRSCLRDGDCGVILDDDGYLQGVEADLIANPDEKDQPDDAQILFGVETDAFNNAKAYWVTPLPSGQGDDQPPAVRIAEQNFIFVANRTRFGQLRGETVYATIFDLLDQINKWKQPTLMAAMVAACFGVAITKNDGGASLFTTANAATNSAGQSQTQINLEPGSVQYLNPGEKVETINPANPGHNFPANLTAMVRLAGLPFGMPLELVLLDFSKTNYSSSRASLQQAYRKFQAWQQMFIDRYLKRVYQWRISKFIKAGLLDPHPEPWAHRWISQPWPYLDPQKELTAIQMGIDIGTDTLTDVLQAQGHNIDEYITRRGAEIKKLAAAGIPLLHSQTVMQYTSPNAEPDPSVPDNSNSEVDDGEPDETEEDELPIEDSQEGENQND
jgi:lambda family phage portal protein